MSDNDIKCVFCGRALVDAENVDLEGDVYCYDGICQGVMHGRNVEYRKRTALRNADKVQIDISIVNQFKDYLAWVNGLPLKDIQLVDRGKPVRVRDGAVSEFMFTGLSNVDFIRCEFYKHGEELAPDDACPADDMRDPCSKKCMECEYNCGVVKDEDGAVTAIRCDHYKFQRLKE